MTTPALEGFPHQDALVEILYGVTMGDPQPYIPEGATMLEVMAPAAGRWLTAHDAATIRQAKAEALREAAAIVELINPPESAAPTWSWDRVALVLTDRASRIELGE